MTHIHYPVTIKFSFFALGPEFTVITYPDGNDIAVLNGIWTSGGRSYEMHKNTDLKTEEETAMILGTMMMILLERGRKKNN